jgi:hypothetical protein
MRLVEEILAEKDWRAKAWYLERTDAEQFGRVTERPIVQTQPLAQPRVSVVHMRDDISDVMHAMAAAHASSDKEEEARLGKLISELQRIRAGNQRVEQAQSNEPNGRLFNAPQSKPPRPPLDDQPETDAPAPTNDPPENL